MANAIALYVVAHVGEGIRAALSTFIIRWILGARCDDIGWRGGCLSVGRVTDDGSFVRSQ